MKKAYQKSIDEIYTELNTSKNGLSKTEVLKRQKTYGLNVLIDKNKRTKLQIFLSQFKNMMIILLLVVGLLSLIYSLITGDDFLEPLVILGTTLVNCIMGYFQESKAANATEKLKKYSANYVTVRRNGTSTDIDAKELVPGDYIILEAGDKVPADARIVESYFAKTDESILTGESNNVEKNEITIPNETILAETYNMIYSGTVIVSGKIEAIVISTGMNTELGKIASVLDTKEEPATPIQMKVAKVSRFITGVAFILIAFVLIFGLINHYTILNIVMLCISMIVASVPESLTIAITATLSIGVSGMAKKKSIVKNLAAIETLGSTEVICTDKTGTLTENKMKVTKLYTDNKEIELKDIKNYQTLINVMDNSNSATLASDGLYTGDAVDVAIKNYLKENNLKSEEVTKITELPFDSKRKMMSAVYKKDGETYLYLKGSLEAILQRSTKILINNELQNLTDEYINQYKNIETQMSEESLKVIAFAYKKIDKIVTNEEDYFNEEKDLILTGLAGFKDPIRKNIKASIDMCKEASIIPIMLTGDNLQTAYTIAKEAGICQNIDECINASELSEQDLIKNINKYKVYARVSPETKVQIVKAFQKENKVVAMTGDGVNDAPALKKADVGFAMGSGTEVAKEASDIVILDDNILSITKAISYGRTIFKSIRKFIIFQLTINLCAVSLSIIGPFIGIESPVTVMQMLWINMIMDTLAGIAFSYEAPLDSYMEEKPKPKDEKIMNSYMYSEILFTGIYSSALCIFFLKSPWISSIYRMNGTDKYLMTAFFALFIFMGIFNCFNARTPRLNLLSNLEKNKAFIIIILFIIIVQLYLIYYGGDLFRTYGLTRKELGITIVIAATVIPVDWLRKLITKKKRIV